MPEGRAPLWGFTSVLPLNKNKLLSAFRFSAHLKLVPRLVTSALPHPLSISLPQLFILHRQTSPRRPHSNTRNQSSCNWAGWGGRFWPSSQGPVLLNLGVRRGVRLSADCLGSDFLPALLLNLPQDAGSDTLLQNRTSVPLLA